VTNEGNQIATNIDEKLCLVEIVFLGEPVQEHRHGVSPAGTKIMAAECGI
jgi:hypothetical protein